MKDLASIRSETGVTMGLVIVVFAAAFSIGGVYMKVDDTADRTKEMETRQSQMALDIAAIKQAVGVNAAVSTTADPSLQMSSIRLPEKNN